MVAAAFPIVKLATLAFRQVAKPIANSFKTRAKSSPFFRNYICMPPAQLYHWLEVNVKMKLLGLGKPSQVQKLNEQSAIELGAELLGETIIFTVAAGTLVAEYVRQSRKATAEAAVVEERWTQTERRIEELEFLNDKQAAEVRELTRIVYALKSGPGGSGGAGGKQSGADDIGKASRAKGLFGRAVTDAADSLGAKS
ncbi:unnamed protein product [Medioppia subpectinata]|uniref:OPA3-like protein n=1 Tax=Medioppia subpectinata TaxID=1979941 RepID=A0A7R9L747_9ACAR|nr:unnamed protein product [Medioppia subpectinata]CAG2116392.1 unnamed protein product [Medioppia subpectinata]